MTSHESFKRAVLDHEEDRKRWLTQLRHLLIENAQLSKELEDLHSRFVLPERPAKKPYVVEDSYV